MGGAASSFGPAGCAADPCDASAAWPPLATAAPRPAARVVLRNWRRSVVSDMSALPRGCEGVMRPAAGRRHGTRACSRIPSARSAPKIRVWNRDALPLGIPHDGSHPPAVAELHELDAVDAAREGCRAWFVPRFVGAEDVRDVRELFDPVAHGRLEEPLLQEVRPRPLDVAIRVEDAIHVLPVGAMSGRYQPALRQEQRLEAVPVARARGPGD